MANASADMSIGEVSARSGVSIPTLHFYERKGLLQSRRTSGNQRRYSRAILRRLAVIRIAKQAGIPLAEIRKALQAIPSDDNITIQQWIAFSSDWHDMLEERILRLTQLRDNLTTCIGCGCLSLTDCPLRNPDDALAAEGPGPRMLVKGDVPEL